MILPPVSPDESFFSRYRTGIRIGLAGLALGLVDTAFLLYLGLDFSLSGQDGTLFFGIYLAMTFATLGVLGGVLFDNRRRDLWVSRQQELGLAQLNEFQAKVAQSEKLASLGQMAASLAHEVRNPLAVIRCQVQNAAEDVAEGGIPSAADLDAILDEVDRLSRSVDAIVGFARPLEPHKERVTLGGMLDRMASLSKALLREAPARIQVDPTSEPQASVELDPDLVCQVVLGLVANGAAMCRTNGTIRLHAQTSQNEVTFSVEDDGPGVPKELREKIFQPFFTTRENGHGLGLAVAQQIARAHGGRLSVGDGGLGGARFSLQLPQPAGVGRG
ncbi:Histidine kinase domain-containing protein [Sulfidibacter corallicola]|uniref:histidine kinase n=1 Tax=Sulfidibacter corallicola TaxID=2818388 RepID=A0A8A4TP38_SULCO|nr:ATP-binding protein [Sulfidibacter corallicola]QTD51313.1 hypothetical protein J3U87_02495 [Sulfidibacter corallicola]